jgi:hypothetical protein
METGQIVEKYRQILSDVVDCARDGEFNVVGAKWLNDTGKAIQTLMQLESASSGPSEAFNQDVLLNLFKEDEV